MGAALGLTRTDHTSGERPALSRKSNSAQVRRLRPSRWSLTTVRAEAATLAGMDPKPCATGCIAATHQASKA